SSTSLRRATSTVLAPSAAKFSAMALPMPELAPVTMATRSSSCFMGDALIRYHGDGAHLDQVLGALPSWSPRPWSRAAAATGRYLRRPLCERVALRAAGRQIGLRAAHPRPGRLI